MTRGSAITMTLSFLKLSIVKTSRRQSGRSQRSRSSPGTHQGSACIYRRLPVGSHLTQVIDGDLVKTLSWCDNESGYAHQLVRQAS